MLGAGRDHRRRADGVVPGLARNTELSTGVMEVVGADAYDGERQAHLGLPRDAEALPERTPTGLDAYLAIPPQPRGWPAPRNRGLVTLGSVMSWSRRRTRRMPLVR